MEHHNLPTNEIEPPWVKHPDILPYDTFWRQSGEIWFKEVWEPYWLSLTEEQKEAYLDKWNVPKKWVDFYFDMDFAKLLEEADS